ncbi:FusB/FusC family EF-G-binding protein [Metabacillus endolithicus]|uniref:FusB/FusC family EF-G-binding protein n=1 Tax=Metabacillus endolithicus TaxID=1535204 RepID=A0ABW5C0Z2_9BACI|nr:FusB/FusC family EF-G-binding protein [Metabacillus endolithicus]UPG65315.1 FusB/FusC family EF-G-binding protein [Metabacillus endolithicus]
MKPFIKSYQYNVIKSDVIGLVNVHESGCSMDVLDSIKQMMRERIYRLFPNLEQNKKALFDPIFYLNDKKDALVYLLRLKMYVIPFGKISEQLFSTLFDNEKSVKLPSIETIDLRDISYFKWQDPGVNKQFIIATIDNELVGIKGIFTRANKGICEVCNRYEEIGVFTIETDTLTKQSHYMCQDNMKCNQNLTSLDSLHRIITPHTDEKKTTMTLVNS